VARDADAFAQILSRHSAMVYTTCKRILRDAAEAEDVAQECFVELMRTRARIRSSVGGWLHRLAVSRSLDRIRGAQRRRQREQRFAEAQSQQVKPEWDDVLSYVDEALEELAEHYRTPILYRFFENQTHDAIGHMLGISESAVRARIDKGVEQIRRRLKRRSIVVPAAVLTAALDISTSEAAPASLTGSLAKIAIAGAGPGAAAGSAATTLKLVVTAGVTIMTKKALAGLGVLILLTALTWFWSSKGAVEEPPVTRPVKQLHNQAPSQPTFGFLGTSRRTEPPSPATDPAANMPPARLVPDKKSETPHKSSPRLTLARLRDR